MDVVSGHKPKLNLNLEALRGYAALFVVINHLEALSQVFNAQYLPRPLIVFTPNGHLFVLVFFVLSGYVIAISHPQQMRGRAIDSYVKKRLVRIYPIYFLAILFALFITVNHYPAAVIAGNFLVLQMLFVPVIITNTPIWSLHYEMVYYGLFIPISRFGWNGWMILLASVLITLAGAGMISAYFLGLAFWIGGFCIARYLPAAAQPASQHKMVAMLFLLLSLDQILSRPGLASAIGQLADHPTWWYPIQNWPNYSPLINSGKDLVFLPFYLFVVFVFAGRAWKYQRTVFMLLHTVLVMAILLTLYNWLFLGQKDHILVYLISVGYYLVSLLLWNNNSRLTGKICNYVIGFGAWIGGVSYAVYVIHAPLIYIIGKITFTAQMQVNYIIKLVLFVAVLTIFAYLLEKKLQPWLRKRMLGSPQKSYRN